MATVGAGGVYPGADREQDRTHRMECVGTTARMGRRRIFATNHAPSRETHGAVANDG